MDGASALMAHLPVLVHLALDMMVLLSRPQCLLHLFPQVRVQQAKVCHVMIMTWPECWLMLRTDWVSSKMFFVPNALHFPYNRE